MNSSAPPRHRIDRKVGISGGGPSGQMQVDVLQRRADDLEPLDHHRIVQSPVGEGVQAAGGRMPAGSRNRTRGRAWSRPPRVAGVPSATILPEAITATRLARYWASSM